MNLLILWKWLCCMEYIYHEMVTMQRNWIKHSADSSSYLLFGILENNLNIFKKLFWALATVIGLTLSLIPCVCLQSTHMKIQGLICSALISTTSAVYMNGWREVKTVHSVARLFPFPSGDLTPCLYQEVYILYICWFCFLVKPVYNLN